MTRAKLLTFYVSIFTLVCVSSAAADPVIAPAIQRGFVTTAPCPLTCKDLKVPAEMCKEFKMGTLCAVEDFSLPPGHHSLAILPVGTKLPSQPSASNSRVRRTVDGTWITVSNDPNAIIPFANGFVTSSECPFSCSLAKVPAEFCREWQRDATCYVEDLRQPAGHQTMLKLDK